MLPLPPLPALYDLEQPFVQLCTQGVFAQAGDGGGAVDDRRGDGCTRFRHHLPGRFPVEAGEGEGDAAGLSEGDDSSPVRLPSSRCVRTSGRVGDGNCR